MAVTIKVLADTWAVDADVRERFTAEARLLRRTETSRVVRVHDVGVLPGEGGYLVRPFFVMEYTEGGTLADRSGVMHIPGSRATSGGAAGDCHQIANLSSLWLQTSAGSLAVMSVPCPRTATSSPLGCAWSSKRVCPWSRGGSRRRA